MRYLYLLVMQCLKPACSSFGILRQVGISGLGLLGDHFILLKIGSRFVPGIQDIFW